MPPLGALGAPLWALVAPLPMSSQNPPVYSTGVQADFFSFAQRIFPFSNLKPFPFKPKETKIRKENFYEMKEREENSFIFVVWERFYNMKININTQTWLLNHYWLFLLEYFFPPRGGLGPKGCVGHIPMPVLSTTTLLWHIYWIRTRFSS